MAVKQKEIIEKTQTPVSKTMIVKGLKALGLNAQSKVEVHTSLSSFGYIINKEYDIIDALLEVISEGVIMMPAHTGEYTDPAYWVNPPVPKAWIPLIKQHRKPFDKDVFLTERIGRVPNAFLKYPDVKRSNHPTTSLSVYNQTNDQTWLNHSLHDDDDINPLYKLANEQGKILFLGAPFSTCTSIHLTERFAKATESITSECIMLDLNKRCIEVQYTYYEWKDETLDNFKMIEQLYKEKYQNTDYARQVKIGSADCLLIDAQKLYKLSKTFHTHH